MKKLIAFLLFGTTIATSCVSKKELTDANSALNSCKATTEAQNIDINNMRKHITQLQYDSAAAQKAIDKFLNDSITQSKSLHQAKMEIRDLKEANKQLAERVTGSSNSSEIKSLLADLQKTQEKLQKREDALNESEKNLKNSQAALEKSAKSLAEKEKKVNELSAIINKQDSILKDLRTKVDAAFKSFQGKGIEVVNKNGKVYVSLDEKLMFKSGKWEVDEKGSNALNTLSKFLAENKDINVVVEGHTDSLAYRGNGYILDNWDLSTKRATAIVRILLENKDVNPAKISATGRAEFCPINDNNTSESRSKNRRTEIILSPNLDELLEAMLNSDK